MRAALFRFAVAHGHRVGGGLAHQNHFFLPAGQGRVKEVALEHHEVAFEQRNDDRRVFAALTFVNADAVSKMSIEVASKNNVGISFVLAGQRNRFALEDFICAGGIIDRFPKGAVEFSDKALGALLAYNGAKHNLQENISKSKHAQKLLKIGFGKDIEFACQIDLYSIVPCYKNGVTQV